jgi:hypothetical protein
MIFTFSQELDRSRVYYIQSIGNSLEKFNTLIEDEEQEFIYENRSNAQNDNEPFLNLLNKSIKNIQKDKAKRWKLKFNGSDCQMLVLNNYCSKPKSVLGPLRKKN